MVDELNPEESAGLLNHDLATKSDSELEEIGRASCRERVCLYV